MDSILPEILQSPRNYLVLANTRPVNYYQHLDDAIKYCKYSAYAYRAREIKTLFEVIDIRTKECEYEIDNHQKIEVRDKEYSVVRNTPPLVIHTSNDVHERKDSQFAK